MSVILKLKMMRENFSKMEQKIADYILNHPEEVKQLTTYQVAKICKTSQASIVRFAKKMGFSGYPDFKLSLSQDIGVRSAKKEVSIIDSEINSDDRDRKSTRLNSSHANISYAAFCLIKHL